jgi:hypothetical protein
MRKRKTAATAIKPTTGNHQGNNSNFINGSGSHWRPPATTDDHLQQQLQLYQEQWQRPQHRLTKCYNDGHIRP